MENKHIEYPSMPFDIDDKVYYMKKVLEKGGHPGYKVIKLICCGYFNFGKGWHMRLRNSKYNKFDEYNLPITDAGYTVFYSETDIKDRLKDINGFIVENS